MANLRQGVQALSASRNGATDGALIAAISGNYVYITDLVISVGGTGGTLTVKTGGSSGTVLIDSLNLAANSNFVCNYTTPLKGSLGGDIYLDVTSATPLSVHATYYTASK